MGLCVSNFRIAPPSSRNLHSPQIAERATGYNKATKKDMTYGTCVNVKCKCARCNDANKWKGRDARTVCEGPRQPREQIRMDLVYPSKCHEQD